MFRKKQFLIFTISLVVVVSLSITFQSLLAAWSGPTTDPPDGNVPAPINIGSTGQSKDGGLILNHLSGTTHGLIVENGNVGIGTTGPSDPLHVAGIVRINDGLKINSSGFYGTEKLYVNGTSIFQNGITVGYSGDAAPANGMIVSGNVGIGTTTPNRKLYVKSGSAGFSPSDYQGVVLESDTHQTLSFISPANTQQGIQFGGEAEGDAHIYWEDGTRGDYLNFNSALAIKNGNVGIGTTGPTIKAQVKGTAVDPVLATYNGIFGLESAAQTSFQMGIGLSFNGTWFQSYNQPATGGGTYNLILNPLGGNVGIGTTNPGNKLEIALARTDTVGAGALTLNGAQKWSFRSSLDAPANGLAFDTYNGATWSTPFVISNIGNVGIGTTAPGATLHITSTGTDLLKITRSGDRTWGLKAAGAFVITDVDNGKNVLTLENGAPNYAIYVKSTGNVGIGTMNPGSALHVIGTGRFEGGDFLRINSAAGANQKVWRQYVDNNSWYLATMPDDLSSENLFLRFIRSGTSIVSAAFLQGNVGIGTTGPGYTLTVNGSAWVTSGAWTGSDSRWKKDMSPLKDSLNKIVKLQGINYNWRTEEFPELKFSTASQIGLIAQDTEKIVPEVVTTDNNGYKGISYEKLVPVTIEAIKELKAEKDAEIKELKAEKDAEIAELKAEIAELKN